MNAERYGYDEADIVTLTDDNSDSSRKPTKSNIVRPHSCRLYDVLIAITNYLIQLHWMDWLVKDAQPDDSLLFQCMSCAIVFIL